MAKVAIKCSVCKSKSSDMLTSVEYELETLNYVSIRKSVEEFVENMIKLHVLSIESLRNLAIRGCLVDKLMKKYEFSYVKEGQLVRSMFENVIQCKISSIPMHSKINLDKWCEDEAIEELDDDEYLRQSLMLMNA